MKRISVLERLFALACGLALVSPGPAAAAAFGRIGVAGGVQGVVKAFPQASGPEKPVGRVLSSGHELFLNEKISTGPKGRLQIMLLDETIFTIGPNSSMVLDEFVYDPASGAGKVTAKVTQGVFRFVTGRIGHSKPSDMKVKFPVGTMGIRGTIVAGEVTPAGTTAVLLGPGPATNAAGERVGAFSMENGGITVDVVKPGFGTSVDANGGAPSAPALIPAEQLHGILGALAPEPKAGPDSPADHPEAREADGANNDTASPANDAGQDTAGAAGDLANTEDVADLGSGLNSAVETASNDIEEQSLEDFIHASQASWDDIRAIPSGQGQYAGTDFFYLTQCAGGACANPSGSMDFVMNIDFGARTYGGSVAGAATASRLNISMSDSTIGTIVDTVNIVSTSYNGLPGAAHIAPPTTAGGTTATVDLLFGGVAAVARADYNKAGTTGTGAVFAPIADCSIAGACR